MSKMKIALDAGHGLYTSGRRCLARFDPAQTREWQLNARIMSKLEAKLRGYDCEVLRVDDVTGVRDVKLEARVAAADRFGADLYLSLHHNAGIGGGNGGGTVVYHNSDIPADIALADKLYRRIVAETGLAGNRSRKVIKKAYYVLLNKGMRRYLIENGFMDSAADTPVILTESHAGKTAQGILNWLEEDLGLEKKDASEPEKPATDAFVTGAKVTVNGTIYATGKGTGQGIVKSRAEMYITDYAGDRYPYCWGVSKTAGGVRQGWARAEDLSASSGRDENRAGGDPSAYKEWPGICSEPNVNVRVAPGADKAVLTAWPRLGRGNEVDVIGEGTASDGKRWYRLRIAGIYTGWVYGEYIKRR